jgi:hypothetical protein
MFFLNQKLKCKEEFIHWTVDFNLVHLLYVCRVILCLNGYLLCAT